MEKLDDELDVLIREMGTPSRPSMTNGAQWEKQNFEKKNTSKKNISPHENIFTTPLQRNGRSGIDRNIVESNTGAVNGKVELTRIFFSNNEKVLLKPESATTLKWDGSDPGTIIGSLKCLKFWLEFGKVCKRGMWSENHAIIALHLHLTGEAKELLESLMSESVENFQKLIQNRYVQELTPDELKGRIYSLKQNFNETGIEFLRKMKENYRLVCGLDLISERAVVKAFISGLRDNWKRSNQAIILELEKCQSIAEVESLFGKHASLIKEAGASLIKEAGEPTDIRSNKQEEKKVGKKKKSQETRLKDKEEQNCFWCHKKGHIKRDCEEWKRADSDRKNVQGGETKGLVSPLN